jgi:hypothetical protein
MRSIQYIQGFVLIIIILEMLFWQYINQQFKDKHFIMKKITDTIRLLVLYFWCVFYFYYYQPIIQNKTYEWYDILYMLIPSALILLFYCVGLKYILLYNSKNVKRKVKLSIIISMLLAIIIFFASLNFCIYYIDVNAFSTLNFSEWYKVAFEFLYYSFTVSITYSSGSIEPNSIITKLVAMIQIIMFYYVVGEGIFNIFNNLGKSTDD